MCMGRIRRTRLLCATTSITCTMVSSWRWGRLMASGAAIPCSLRKLELERIAHRAEYSGEKERGKEGECSNEKFNEVNFSLELAHVQEFDKIPASRPNSVSVNAAICDERRTVHFVGRKSHGQESSSE